MSQLESLAPELIERIIYLVGMSTHDGDPEPTPTRSLWPLLCLSRSLYPIVHRLLNAYVCIESFPQLMLYRVHLSEHPDLCLRLDAHAITQGCMDNDDEALANDYLANIIAGNENISWLRLARPKGDVDMLLKSLAVLEQLRTLVVVGNESTLSLEHPANQKGEPQRPLSREQVLTFAVTMPSLVHLNLHYLPSYFLFKDLAATRLRHLMLDAGRLTEAFSRDLFTDPPASLTSLVIELVAAPGRAREFAATLFPIAGQLKRFELAVELSNPYDPIMSHLLPQLTSVRILGLSGSLFLSDEGINSIAGCVQLRGLKIEWCEELTFPTLRRFLEILPLRAVGTQKCYISVDEERMIRAIAVHERMRWWQGRLSDELVALCLAD